MLLARGVGGLVWGGGRWGGGEGGGRGYVASSADMSWLTPALWRMTSMWPKRDQAWWILAVRVGRSEVMSSSRRRREEEGWRRGPRRASTLRPVAMTLSPRRRSSWTTALPMPEVVPVTSQTWGAIVGGSGGAVGGDGGLDVLKTGESPRDFGWRGVGMEAEDEISRSDEGAIQTVL